MSDNPRSSVTNGASHSELHTDEFIKLIECVMNALQAGELGYIVNIEHRVFDPDRLWFKRRPKRKYRVRPFNPAELEAIAIGINTVPIEHIVFTVIAKVDGELCNLWGVGHSPPRNNDSHIAAYLKSRGIVLEPRL
jgi:hypothetical protein